MIATIQTKSGPLDVHVCKDGNGDGDGWIEVYRDSFPDGQRQGVPEIRELLRTGAMELDETRDQDERVLCMTLTEVFGAHPPEFLLACYTATRPDLRSLGIGSLHRRRLVELLRGEYGGYIGLFTEIESTLEEGLDPETLETRRRRLAFFLRLGLERLPVDYRFPSFAAGAAPMRGELLWVPFGSRTLDPTTLRQVLERIYTEGYGLSASDPFVAEAIKIAIPDGSGP